ncbi:MAG TPA: prolipoprotein diacylglyceryl transferase family protein [Candidatus Polarisedimenticolaceae bacterium]|nr:prolipoprotein diacylglyceryl transferase family protein [Candidatus Polarisedimenticolaceae bacterium]
MFPILIDAGRHDLPLLGETRLFLPTYGVLFAAGVVLAWVWFIRRTRGMGLPEERLFNLTFYSVLAGIIGAKLLLIAIDWRVYLSNPGEILGTLRSAGVLMGGVFAAAITFYVYCQRQGLPVWKLADAVAAPLVFAQAVGRLGCHSAGCCWGVGVDAGHPLAVVFRDPRAREQTGVPLDTPLFATQLTEMAFDALLAVALTLIWRRGVRPAGTVFWIYVLAYSVGRGVIELWRGDVHRGLFFGGAVSTSQLIAAATAAVALAALIRGRGVLARDHAEAR